MIGGCVKKPDFRAFLRTSREPSDAETGWPELGLFPYAREAAVRDRSWRGQNGPPSLGRLSPAI